jgi:hypothetical protein
MSKRMKQRSKPKINLKLVNRSVAYASFFIVLSLVLLINFQFISPKKTYAAATGDYRSAASGDWTTASTWEYYNGSSWVPASATPTANDGMITILNGDTVTVNSSFNDDQTVVDPGGVIIIAVGKNMQVKGSGSGTDLTVNGTVIIYGAMSLNTSKSVVVNGTVILASGGSNTCATSSTMTINNGGRYINQGGTITTAAGYWTVNSGGVFEHNYDGGTLPLATWNTGSTCEITGVITSLPANLNQSFYNLTWNCANQTASALDWGGVCTTINGDFKIVSTGTGEIMLGKTAIYTIAIGGNIIQQGGTVYCTRHNCTINLSGNFIQSGGTFSGTDVASSGAGDYLFTLNVTGNFSIASGTFDFTRYSGSSSGKGIGRMNITGNFTQTGGTFTETANTTANSGYGQVYFQKSGTQTFSKSAGTMNNMINYTVNNGSILDMGTSYTQGTGTFSVLSGGALIMASLAGITATSANGNVQVTGTRSYSTSANYTFNGTGAQVTGDGLPSTINNLTIDNSSHVTLTNTASVSGILTLANGQIITNANELIITNSAPTSINGYSSTNYVRGNLRRYVNSTGAYDFPLGTSSFYEYINVTLSSGSGFTNILGSFTNANPVNPSNPISEITINDTLIDAMLNYGYWTLTPNSAMTSGTYSVTLKERGYTNRAPGGAGYCVLKRTNSSSSWQSLGTHSSSSYSESNNEATATRTSLTSFSQFGIGRNAAVGSLPIKLINFDAKRNKEIVELVWATATEINNDYFSIERSTDGIHFEAILMVPGAGNSTVTKNYKAVDPNPPTIDCYYRLKQTDYDGHFTYSSIKFVKFNSSGILKSDLTLSSIGPNPFTSKFTLSFSSSISSSATFQLINPSGKVVFTDKINTIDGFNSYEFNDNNDLVRGLYFAVLECKGEKIVQKIYKE